MSLIQHFDRIAVISLPDRVDRRSRLLGNLQQHGLATAQDLTWVEAVDGRKQNVPAWWLEGPGAWGCRASQLAVIQAAQRDGLETVLILEDDAYFHHRAAEWLSLVMPLVPADWDLFFLGGQHMAEPTRTADPRILRGTGITRTHAYAVHRRAFATLIDHVGDISRYEANPTWHIDHQYAHGQRLGHWTAYAPAWWLAGQEEGPSNINEATPTLARRWWFPGDHYWHLPFVRPPADEAAAEWVYFPEPASPLPEAKISRALWLRTIAREAWLQGRLPSCSLEADEISQLWPGGHRAPRSLTELTQLADYPANRLFPHAFATFGS